LEPNLGKPYVGRLSSGLYEIRAKGKEGIGRSIDSVVKGQEVVILYSFIKKTQKTPKKDLDLGKKRMKEVLK
jgi:phage-related protein